VRVSFRRPDPEPRRELGGDRLHLGERPSEGLGSRRVAPRFQEFAGRRDKRAPERGRQGGPAIRGRVDGVQHRLLEFAEPDQEAQPIPRVGDPGQGVQFVPSFDLAARIPEDDHPATSDPLAGKPHT